MRWLLASLAVLAFVLAGCDGDEEEPVTIIVTATPGRPAISEEAAISAVVEKICPRYAHLAVGMTARENGENWSVDYAGSGLQATFSVIGASGEVFAENDDARTAIAVFGRSCGSAN
jgi:hypothetical protein